MAMTDDPRFDPPQQPLQPQQPRRPVGLAQEMGERLKGITKSRPFLLYLVIVTVLAGLYFFVIATPVYVSNTSFSIRGREKAQGMPSVTSLLGGGSAGADPSETAEVADYISSPEMLTALDKKLRLRDLYSQFRIDPFNTLSKNASAEDFLKFYRKRVIPRVDRESYIVRVEVRSFDAKSAHATAETLLNLTAEYVNNLSAKIRADTLRSAESELAKAENDVRMARINVTRYRTNTGVVDPTTAAAATSSTIHGLESQVMAAQAEAAAISTYSTGNAPLMQQNAAKIAALRAQIEAEKRRLASNAQPTTNLAQRVYEYEGLAVDKDYAEKRLVVALESYDQARALAAQRERFVVRVTNPNYPDEPVLPKRLLNFFETIIVAVAGYAIIALAIAGVRDHQGI